MAMTKGTQEVMWERQLLKEVGLLTSGPTSVYGGNRGCISTAVTKRISDQIKHIDIRHRYIRDCVDSQDITVTYVSTTCMLADILTKPLPRDQFIQIRTAMGIVKE